MQPYWLSCFTDRYMGTQQRVLLVLNANRIASTNNQPRLLNQKLIRSLYQVTVDQSMFPLLKCSH